MFTRPTLRERMALCSFCGFHGRQDDCPFCDPCWEKLPEEVRAAWEEYAFLGSHTEEGNRALFRVLLKYSHCCLAITCPLEGVIEEGIR